MPACSKVPRSAAGQAAPHRLPWHWCRLFPCRGMVLGWPSPGEQGAPPDRLGVPGDDVLETLAWLCAAVWCWGGSKSPCRACHCPQRHFYQAGLLCGWRSQRAGSSCCVTLFASVPRRPCPFLGAALWDSRAVPTLGVMPCRHFPPSWDFPSPWRAVQNTCQHPESSCQTASCLPAGCLL